MAVGQTINHCSPRNELKVTWTCDFTRDDVSLGATWDDTRVNA